MPGGGFQAASDSPEAFCPDDAGGRVALRTVCTGTNVAGVTGYAPDANAPIASIVKTTVIGNGPCAGPFLLGSRQIKTGPVPGSHQ